MTAPAQELVARLTHLRVTMTNDDTSTVGSDMRQRFLDRMETAQDAADWIEAALSREAAFVRLALLVRAALDGQP